jgi:hypothetical protein
MCVKQGESEGFRVFFRKRSLRIDYRMFKTLSRTQSDCAEFIKIEKIKGF